MSPDRLVRCSDLVLPKEIAERLGLDANKLSNLMSGHRRSQFPEPVAGTRSQGVYVWDDILDWWIPFKRQSVEAQRHRDGSDRVRRYTLA